LASNEATFFCRESATIVNGKVNVDPPSSISCPAQFYFSATITRNSAGDVGYHWERSDGTASQDRVEQFSSNAPTGGQTVDDTWCLSVSDTSNFTGWERLHITYPNDVISQQASFTLTCPGGPGGYGGTFPLHVGWNMISSPGASAPVSSLQGDCSFTGGPWWWDGSQYQQPATIDPGKGYWVKVDRACTIQALASLNTQSFTLFDGWNMISSLLSWNTINLRGNCTLLSGPWWFDGQQYQQVAPDKNMEVFKGYWVKVGKGPGSSVCKVLGAGLHGSWDDSFLPPGPPVESRMQLALLDLRVTMAKAGEIELQIKGHGIVSSEVHVYALSGQLLADAHGTASQLHFMILSPNGQPLANGVYLYLVTVHGANGETLNSGIKKFVILR
jgi:hypothetical protein